MKTALLRQIDAQVARVNRHGECSSSPEYVFAIGPRSRSHEEDQTTRRQDLDHATLDKCKVSIVHEVPRTYSECRTLYRELQQLTDCTKVQACCCALGSCPFWSLFAVLDRVKFPRRTLFNRQSKSICTQRTHALNAFMRALLSVLRTNYRTHHFGSYAIPFNARVCKVLVALCLFLELDNADMEKRLLEGREQHAYQLNLQGWQSDRLNLYFHCEKKQSNAKGIRDHKSIEWRQSLAMSDDDDEKDPVLVVCDKDEELQRRGSLLLGWN